LNALNPNFCTSGLIFECLIFLNFLNAFNYGKQTTVIILHLWAH